MDLEPSSLEGLIGAALSHQVAQFTVAFGIAAYIHSGRMKKEIGRQLSCVTDAVNNLACALRQDLANQSERIGHVEKGLGTLNNRVSEIEKKST